MAEEGAADGRGDRGQRARPPARPVAPRPEDRADRQQVRERDDGEREPGRSRERPLGPAGLAEDGRRRVPAGVVPHHDGEPEAEAPPALAGREPRQPWLAPGRRERRQRQEGHRRQADPGADDGGATRQPHAEYVQGREPPDEHEGQQPALDGVHPRPPEAGVLHEERRVDRDVDEAVDPAPPADLEAPEGSERPADPGHVAALVGDGRRELGHHDRHGQAPDERGDGEEEEGEPGAERRDRVLDAVGPAAHVEEDDGGQGQEAELPRQAARGLPRAPPGRRHRQGGLTSGPRPRFGPAGRGATRRTASPRPP